jgi:CHAD domain-containing protein
MTILLSTAQIVTKMDEDIKRVDDRLDDYIKDSNENNIHDIRTAIRRLDASYRSLPKNMRRKNKITKFTRTSKRLFKINSQVRDYDIICEKLQKYSSGLIYIKLTGSFNKKRKTKLARARKIALSLRDLAIPHVKESAIPPKKLEMRYNKVVVRLRERIELNLPIVLTNANKLKELHEMRKDSKKLRYLLELTSHQNKEIHTIITELEEIQDTLGTIHDCDTIIAYMKRIRHRNKLKHILDDEVSERNKKYNDFIQFCKKSLSDAKLNFLKQIAALT